MLGEIGLELAIIFILLVANGFFAASEIATVSARKGRLEQLAADGSRGARQALALGENPDRFLATVQVGISLIGTFAAAFGGARLGDALASVFRGVPPLADFAEPLGLTIVVLGITYFSLVIGELVPKRIALQHAEKMAAFSAPIMARIAWLARPVVALLTGSVGLVLRLIGQRKAASASVTEEDIVYMVREGQASGAVDPAEAELIGQVFEFTDRTVNEVMTPRVDLVALDIATPLEDAVDVFLQSGHSRLPVYKGMLDRMVGALHSKDLLLLLKAQPVSNDEVDLMRFVRPVTYVLEHQGLQQVLAAFRRERTHAAIAVDEYGQVAGLITLDDVLAELVGEVQSEHDELSEEPLVRREDGSWLADGTLAYDALAESLDLPELEPEERRLFTTIAGFLLLRFGHIPNAGDTIEAGEYVFEVLDMDGRRIDKLLIRRRAPESEARVAEGLS